MYEHKPRERAGPAARTCIEGVDAPATPSPDYRSAETSLQRARPADRLADVRLETLTDNERARLVALALSVLEFRHAVGAPLRSPAETQAFLRLNFGGSPRELFGALFLDTRHRLLAIETLFAGSIDASSVHLRIVIQRALALNAAALIVYHNHPSGVPEPSRADRVLTARLQEACELVEVRLLDHVVVGVEGMVSFAERGWL